MENSLPLEGLKKLQCLKTAGSCRNLISQSLQHASTGINNNIFIIYQQNMLRASGQLFLFESNRLKELPIVSKYLGTPPVTKSVSHSGLHIHSIIVYDHSSKGCQIRLI